MLGSPQLSTAFADPHRPSQTFTDPHRPSQTLTDFHRPSQTLTDLHRPLQTSTEPHRPSQTLADPHRPTQTFTDPRRPSQTLADLHRPSQTSTDLHRPSQTLADLHRPSQTFTDLHRHAQTLTDLHRYAQTLADFHRPSMTFTDPRRSLAAEPTPPPGAGVSSRRFREVLGEVREIQGLLEQRGGAPPCLGGHPRQPQPQLTTASHGQPVPATHPLENSDSSSSTCWRGLIGGSGGPRQGALPGSAAHRYPWHAPTACLHLSRSCTTTLLPTHEHRGIVTLWGGNGTTREEEGRWPPRML